MNNFDVKICSNQEFGGKVIEISSPKETQKNNTIIKLIMGAIIGFVNGFWGGGGGMICVPLLIKIIKLTEKKSHATTLLIMLPLSLTSLVVYLINGNLDWINSLKIGFGFVIGGLMGAVFLKKISNLWLEIIFSLIIIAGGIKLLI